MCIYAPNTTPLVDRGEYSFRSKELLFQDLGGGAIYYLDKMKKRMRRKILDGKVYSFYRNQYLLEVLKPVRMIGHFDYGRDFSVLYLRSSLYRGELGKLNYFFSLQNVDDAQLTFVSTINNEKFAKKCIEYMKTKVLDSVSKDEVYKFMKKELEPLGAYDNTG